MENEKISQLRRGIDKIDDQIAGLFAERVKLITQIGAEKAKLGADISVVSRENDIIARVTQNVDKQMQPYVARVFDSIMNICKMVEIEVRAGKK